MSTGGTALTNFTNLLSDIASCTAGDTILIPAGTYQINGVTCNKAITIKGAGPTTILVTNTTAAAITPTVAGVVISDMRIDANALSTYTAVDLSSNGGTVTRCTLNCNGGSTAVKTSTAGATISSCTIVDGAVGDPAAANSNVTITGCTFSTTGTDFRSPIRMKTPKNITITDNVINADDCCIAIEMGDSATLDSTMTNCYIARNNIRVGRNCATGYGVNPCGITIYAGSGHYVGYNKIFEVKSSLVTNVYGFMTSFQYYATPIPTAYTAGNSGITNSTIEFNCFMVQATVGATGNIDVCAIAGTNLIIKNNVSFHGGEWGWGFFQLTDCTVTKNFTANLDGNEGFLTFDWLRVVMTYNLLCCNGASFGIVGGNNRNAVNCNFDDNVFFRNSSGFTGIKAISGNTGNTMRRNYFESLAYTNLNNAYGIDLDAGANNCTVTDNTALGAANDLAAIVRDNATGTTKTGNAYVTSRPAAASQTITNALWTWRINASTPSVSYDLLTGTSAITDNTRTTSGVALNWRIGAGAWTLVDGLLRSTSANSTLWLATTSPNFIASVDVQMPFVPGFATACSYGFVFGYTTELAHYIADLLANYPSANDRAARFANQSGTGIDSHNTYAPFAWTSGRLINLKLLVVGATAVLMIDNEPVFATHTTDFSSAGTKVGLRGDVQQVGTGYKNFYIAPITDCSLLYYPGQA